MGLDLFFSRRSERYIGYFRKVNFLVKYFENKGFDVENQTPLDISKEEIEELIDRCEKVLQNNDLAKELLPTMSGFFFGSTDYDEYYFDSVKEVLEYCKTLLPMFDELDEGEHICFSTWY